MSDTVPFASMFTDPTTQGLLAAAGAAGQMAMPTRMPIPFGAVLGQTAAGFGQGAHNAYATQLAQAQAEQERLKNQLVASQLPVQQAQNEWMLQMYKHPEVLRNLFGQGTATPNAPALPGQAATYSSAPIAGSERPVIARDNSQTAGMQANNPSNLTYAGQPGVTGVIPISGGRNLAAFPDMPSGIAAAAKQLMINQDQHGVNTVRQQVSRWVSDPNADLKTYTADTAKAIGVDPDAPVDWHDPKVQVAFLKAQYPHESAGGSTSLQDADVLKGVQMATAPSRGVQYAQAGNVATDAVPGAPAAAPAGAEPISPGNALNTALQYEARANQMEMISKLPPAMQLPMLANMGMRYEDPTVLRQAAQQYRELAIAGPKAGAEAAAKAPFTNQRVNAGGVLFDANGNVKGFAPVQSTEIITDGPYKGRTVTVLRNPIDNSIVGAAPPYHTSGAQMSGGASAGGVPQAGAPAAPAPGEMPAGSIPKELSPQEHEQLVTAGKVPSEQLAHDRTVVEDDLGHVIDNVISAKQQLFQLRELNAAAAPGAAGELRMQLKNWVQTFAPSLAGQVGDAAPAQEFKKIALMGAGKQERGDLGARGGFRAIELYLHANPSLENQPTANHDMANALLVSHQLHEDYAQGASNFYNLNYDKFTAPGGSHTYTPLSRYDQAFITKFRPELYASAIAALNGKPSDVWAKGLDPEQQQIVGGILQRVDPRAVVDLHGKQIPVAAFTKTVSPQALKVEAPNGG